MNIAKYFFNWLTGQNFTLYLGGGGGGGAPQQSTSTSYQTNIPEYAKPYVETMLGATQKQLFQGTPQEGGGFDITGFQPYKAYGGTYDASGNQTSYDPSKSIAGFQPMQQTAMSNAANMQSNPETFAQGVGGYMSPFAQYALQPQLQEASRQSAIQGTQQQAQAAQAGAFGGGRDALMRSERERNLGQQQSNIMATGMQNAYNQAQQQYNTGFQQNLGINALQAQYGGQQQALEQQKINQSMQDFANAQQYPLMQLGTMSNMIRGLPMQASTTNQYVAAPNSVTQAIGAVGAGTSLANALKGASGGLPKEFKKSGIISYAEGGQTDSKLDTIAKLASIARDTGNLPSLSYSAGGISNDIEHDLYNMDEDDLQKQLKESSSPSVKRMAQRILREKQMENQPGMAGGGIIAFAQPTEENNQSLVEEKPPASTSSGILQQRVLQGKPTGDVMAQPAPVNVQPTQGIIQTKPPTMAEAVQSAPDLTPAMKAAQADAAKTAAVPTQDIYARKQAERAAMGIEAPGIEQRAKLMAEKANAADEAERTRWLRRAEFFARWGSTPGATLTAGMKAVYETVPTMISDEKDITKVRMDIDKSLASLDEATRLEKKGDWEAATVEKNKAAEVAKAIDMEILKIQETEAAGVRADKRKAVHDVEAGKREEAKDIRYATLHKDITQMKIDSDERLKKIDAAWRAADKTQAGDDRLIKIWEVANQNKMAGEAKIANILKSEDYDRAVRDASTEITTSSSPAQIKIQKDGQKALESFNKSFETIRSDGERGVAIVEERLKGRKIDVPTTGPKLTGEDKSALDWANNPKSPGWTKEKADAIKKTLGVH